MGPCGSTELCGAPRALWGSAAPRGPHGVVTGFRSVQTGVWCWAGGGDTHGGEQSAEALLSHLQLEGAPEGRLGPWGHGGVSWAPAPHGAAPQGHTFDGEDLVLQLLLDAAQCLKVVHTEDVRLGGGRGDGLQLRHRLGVLEGAAHLRGRRSRCPTAPPSHSRPRALGVPLPLLLPTPSVPRSSRGPCSGVPTLLASPQLDIALASPVLLVSPQHEVPSRPASSLRPHGLHLTWVSPRAPRVPAVPPRSGVLALCAPSHCPTFLVAPPCPNLSVSPVPLCGAPAPVALGVPPMSLGCPHSYWRPIEPPTSHRAPWHPIVPDGPHGAS